MSTPEPGVPGSRQRPEQTAERRITGWQRAPALDRLAGFLGLAGWNSQRVSFSGGEWTALVAAVGISMWCTARPLGGPKVELTRTEHLSARSRRRPVTVCCCSARC